MELFKSRPKVTYTNKAGDKVYPVVVDIKKGIKSTEDIQFVSSDVNTGILSVAFIQGNDNYNVTGADVVCSVMRPDASTLELPCEVVGENIVEVPLGINGTSQDGVYSFDFKVFKGENKVVGTPIMNYSVSLSISNDMVVEEDDRLPVLTVLMTQLTELKDEAGEVINQANTATEASKVATAKAIEATANANAVSERVSQETSEAISRVDNKVNEVETRFNALTTSQQQDAEVIDARDGEVSLKARLDRDIEKAKQVYVELEGSYISTESSTGAIQDLEILGNTVQDPNNLADIKSVGELQEDGTYKMSILSCGKNLFNPLNKNIECSIGGSQNKVTYKVEGDKIIIKSNPSVSSDWGWVEFKNIKVTPNKSYTIHPNATVIKGNVCVFVFDSNNTKLFEIPNTSKTFIPTTKHITIRLYVQTTTSYTDAEIHYKPQLEEGTQSTPYEPYQGNKCDILLPCQLEKVGDVSDRLYYDDVEKAWCIEKNVGNVVFNGSEDWVKNTIDTSTTSNVILSLDISNTEKAISDRFIYKQSWCTGEEHFYLDIRSDSKAIVVEILKTKLETDDTNGFKKWLSSNNFTVKYILKTPQKIVLPLDVQIQLNSFFGTTHVYMESGEVEGTIKCKIPKSLGATVQSLNNKTDILSDRIEAIEGLKDSQNMKYETDKGYLVCKETKNGVIDDLKIEGKTLVNRTDIFNKVNPTGGGAHRKTSNSLIVDYNKCGELDNSYSLDEINVFKSGQIYTIIIDIIQNTLNQKVEFYPMIWDFATIISGNQFVNTGEVGRKIFVIKSNKDYALKLAYASPGQATQGVTGLVEFKDIMVLDGDYTNIELPNYFEGLMSVGEDVDKIEVLSNNKNLFSGEIRTGRYDENGTFHSDNRILTTTKFLLPPNKNFKVSCKRLNTLWVNFWTKEDIHIKQLTLYSNDVLTTPLGAYKCSITSSIDYDLEDLQIEEGTQITSYIPPQSDKKQILFYNENGELEPIQELHEWDSIEKHSDNKWYYHKRSGKVVLNGSENWIIDDYVTKETSLHFRVNGASYNLKPTNNNYNSAKLICDKFTPRSADFVWCTDSQNPNGVFEGIAINTSGFICARVLKSKLSTQDVEGFKQWLQANNVTVVYQLAQEEVYELAPLHLDSYANETLILCNSGAISPRMEFSITSHINELVKSQGDRISLLEEKMYKALKQVLAGDMYSLAELLYPEDFVEENPENEIMLIPFE